ncbi:CHAT domain-containing protein [Leptothoe sp. LEGE 181152]|nr:CHAT domain-containing protein [Leptothoe sp. LEGE 181152]
MFGLKPLLHKLLLSQDCANVPVITLRLLLLVICILLPQKPGLAQIVPDSTLPNPSTVPTGADSGTLPNVVIEGGTQSNTTLFHSFDQFNVNSNQEVRFANPADVENIFSRVTGGRLSNINGLLGVNGVANLFFLNPNGVVFGPDAELNLNGSLVVSTADQFLFPGGNSFSAVNPQAPPILTLSTPIGLQFGANPQAITVDGASLRMRTGHPLALVGGDVTAINGADFRVQGGRVVLGGLSGPGTLTLNLDAVESEDVVSLQTGVNRANVTLDDARISNQFEGNGDILITAQNITLTASVLETGIRDNSGTPESQTGEIILDATGDIQIIQNSKIVNEFRNNSLGNGGDITIRANNLNVSDRSDISTQTPRSGRAGDILIDVENRILVQGGEELDDRRRGNSAGNPKPDKSRPERSQRAPRTLIDSGSRANESGAPGNITLLAQEIILEGEARVSINHDGPVRGGDITFESDSFQLLSSASVNSVANGTARAGDVNIRASSILLEDQARLRGLGDGTPGIDSTVGNGGRNAIGGTVNITTDNLTVIGVRIGATVLGEGQGGAVVINASDTVTLTTTEASGRTSIASAVRESSPSGTGGDILVNARRLIVENGSAIDAGVAEPEADINGPRISGTITLNIEEDIVLQGTLPDGQPSRILTQLSQNATGAGADIVIDTAELSLADGGQISAATLGNGPGGNVIIRASERITLAGSNAQIELSAEEESNFVANDKGLPSGIFANSPGMGDAGDIEIETPELVLRDRAQISVSSETSGESGNIGVTANNIVLDSGFLSADAIAGEAANITLNVEDTLRLRNGSQISTNAREDANGGNISISNPNAVLLRDESRISAENPGGTGNGGNISIQTDFFVAAPEGLNQIIANADRGDGGNINIIANSLLGTEFREFSASSRFGVDGDVEIDSPNLDPARGTTELPANLTDASNQIANACSIDRQGQAQFVATGRGGLPITPTSQPTGISPLPDLGRLTTDQTLQTNATLQEAQAWSVASNGDIRLTTGSSSETSFLNALLQEAAQAYYQTDYTEAATLWSQTATILTQGDDALTYASTLSNLALVYHQLGDWQQADAAMSASQQLLTSDNATPQIIAQILNTRANLHLSKGNAQAAITDWQQAADSYRNAEDIVGYLQARLNQAQALQSLGLYRQAQPLLATITNSLAEQPPSLLKATALLTLGNGLRNSGDTIQATQTLEAALAIAQDLKQPALVSQILLNLGHTNPTSPDQAVAYYQKALEIAPTALDQLQASVSQFQLLVTQEPKAAQQLWADLEPTLQLSNLPASRESIYAQLYLIHTLLQHSLSSGASESLTTLLNRTNQQALSLQDTVAQTYLLGYQGDFYGKKQQWDKAEAFTQKAFRQAQTLQAPEVIYPVALQLGRLQKAQGKRAQAITAYNAAIEALEILRKDLIASSDDVQFTFRDDIEPIYREFVKLLLQTTGSHSPMKDELRHARQLIENLQVAEVNDYFQDACIQGSPVLADEVDPTAAIIYPILLNDQLDVIISVGDDIQHYSQSVASAEIEKTVRQLLSSFTSPIRAGRPHTTDQLKQVYDWILGPAEDYLAQQNIESLVFVADGVLRTLPLTTLHDGEQYLIEKYNVVLSPGLSLLEPRPLQRQGLAMLAGGLSEARSGFSALPFVPDELQQVTTQIPNNQVLFNQALTKTNLLNSLKTAPAGVVHLATHGEFGSTVEDTFILTWDEKLTMEEMSRVLQARNRSDLSPVELLVFSACKTAAGDSRAVLGIAGTAIRSGVRSTLAGLWAINDQAAATFMAEFYKALAQPETTKAEAFRQAQLALIQDPQLASPYFWSPFVLVGNWL